VAWPGSSPSVTSTTKVGWRSSSEGRTALRSSMACAVPAVPRPHGPGVVTSECTDRPLLEIGSGELAVWDSALDGVEDIGTELRTAVAGRLPSHYEPIHADSPRHPNGLRILVGPGTFRLQVRWRTELDHDACFASWLLTNHDLQRRAVSGQRLGGRPPERYRRAPQARPLASR